MASPPAFGVPVHAGRSCLEDPAPLPCCCWLQRLRGCARCPPRSALQKQAGIHGKPLPSAPGLLPASACRAEATRKALFSPKLVPAISPLPPDPLYLLRACTSAASPPAWPPEPPPRVFFSPLLPSVLPFAIVQWSTLCLGAPGPLPGSRAQFCLCFQRKRETAAELSPTAGPGCCGMVQREKGTPGASGMEGKS